MKDYNKAPVQLLFIVAFLLANLLYIPGISGQAIVIVVSPRYDVTSFDAMNSAIELTETSDDLNQKLISELEKSKYHCIPENSQNWDIFSKKQQTDEMKKVGAKYVISTDQIKIIKSNRPSEKGFEINFIIQKLGADEKLIPIAWYDSKYIIRKEKDRESVADNFTRDFDFYHKGGYFRPRFKINDFEKDNLSKEVDEVEFAKWLKDLLKMKIPRYVFYYDDSIYPVNSENMLTGKIAGVSTGGGNSKNVTLVLMADSEEEKYQFQVRVDSDEFSLPESSKNELIKEIQDKLEKLTKISQ